MVNKSAISIENNFIGGLKTEYTALNFPENACVDADNAVFTIIGETDRRGGFNEELNGQKNPILSAGALATYKWNNVGGDGETQIIVQQTGKILSFYLSSSATTSNPLSTQLLTSTVDVSTFLATNAIVAFDPTVECTFADGNGYLFVFNGQCDPFYVTYNSATQTLTAAVINIQTRDFAGIPDGMQSGSGLSIRPLTLTNEHQYNLVNQGWTQNIRLISNTSQSWTGGSSGNTFSWTFTTTAAQIFPVGTSVLATGYSIGFLSILGSIAGTVTASSFTSVTVTSTAQIGTNSSSNWILTPNPSLLNTWNGVLHNYPSNSDVWWSFRNTNITSASPDGSFDPTLATTYVLATNTQSPQGSVILSSFIQDRTASTGVPEITVVSTPLRPTNGAFYAGRVWYTGLNASFQPTGDAPYFTWTETIYFSQIIQTPGDFGECYQTNDPTSPTLFDLLPSDGGTINIQGSGAIYKLFPIQNGLLAFCANGIWYITGNSQIGFTATDYSVNKISGIQSIGYHSYVNVLGWPVFWNEEGIYEVKPGQDNIPYGHGGFTVNNLCLGTILSFYNDIPLQSKQFARGDYNPITFVIQWIYRSANANNVTDLYTFDKALNLNTYKAPFYPYTISTTPAYVCSVLYVAGPGGGDSPEPTFKYLTVFTNSLTFSEENDFTNFLDWGTTDAAATFTTGYKLHGQMQRQFGIEYIYVFSNNEEDMGTAYSLQSLWDFSTSGNSGKWSAPQVVQNNIPNFNTVFRRMRLRGHGLAVQIKFTSIPGKPFNFAGWSILENQSGNV